MTVHRRVNQMLGGVAQRSFGFAATLRWLGRNAERSARQVGQTAALVGGVAVALATGRVRVRRRPVGSSAP